MKYHLNIGIRLHNLHGFSSWKLSPLKAICISILMLTLAACGGRSEQIYSEEMDRIDYDQPMQLDGPIIEAHSLTGEGLVRPDFDEQTTERLYNDLREAIKNYHEDPDNPDKIIWVGRRSAYLWRYQDAILIFSDGIEDFPDNPRLYRHRGHRYITVREFNKAVDDLKYASELIAGTPDEIEPDGAPNEANIPVSTLHFNIWYHLGLAHYLLEDFQDAAHAFEKSLEVSRNNDTKVSSIDWLYITYMRMGRVNEARALLEKIDKNMEVIESHSYLKRLLMYKGLVKPEELLGSSHDNTLELVTQGYGVAMWYLSRGEHHNAVQILENLIETNYWAAFGYLAAEADLARIRSRAL